MVYTVGEMAKELGVPASTLRYYDQEGLLPFVERSGGGIRIFGEKDYEALLVIECLKKSGLSIKEIKSFMGMVREGDASLAQRLELFKGRREAAQKQLEELERTMALLDYKCWYYETALAAGTERAVQEMGEEDIPARHKRARAMLAHAEQGT